MVTYAVKRSGNEMFLFGARCVGLIVGTRPDCKPELLDYFQALGKTTFVYLEYGGRVTMRPS